MANSQAKQGKDGHQTGGVFKSTDAGESWTRLTNGLPGATGSSGRIDGASGGVGMMLRIQFDVDHALETRVATVRDAEERRIVVHRGAGDQQWLQGRSRKVRAACTTMRS